jgi:hypothetical protein
VPKERKVMGNKVRIRRLRFWNQVKQEFQNNVLNSIFKVYRQSGIEFSQRKLSEDLLAEGFFITTRQCSELIDSLIENRKIERQNVILLKVI